MVEAYERLTGGLFDERVEFHRRENNQGRRTEEQKSETERANQIRIELLNMPVFSVEVSDSRLAEKPKPKELDTGLGFLEIIEMILEMIVKGVKAIFQKGKEA